MTILNRIPIKTIFLLFILLSSFTGLPDKIMGRNSFYLGVIMLIIVGITKINWLSIPKENKLLSLSLLLFGFCHTIWAYCYSHSGDTTLLANQNYASVSHTLIIIGLSLPFIDTPPLRELFYQKKSLFSSLAVIGFIYMCGVGIMYCYNHPGERLRIDSAATVSAYLVTLQCLFTLYLIDKLQSCFKKTLMAIVIIFSFVTLILTETRTAILAFPLLLLLYFFLTREYARKKVLITSVFFIVASPLFIKTFFPATLERINSTYTEISDLHVNNDSSIGARVSMWYSGIYAFQQHPFGQSADSRLKEVFYYIDKNQAGNPEGKRNAVYHLHNDFIETLSLQGIIGGIFYLSLLGAIAYSGFKRGLLTEYLCLFLFPIIIFGSVDTLFIDKRFVIVFGAQLLLYQLSYQPIRQSIPRDNNKGIMLK